jgi:hypothetical protein
MGDRHNSGTILTDAAEGAVQSQDSQMPRDIPSRQVKSL